LDNNLSSNALTSSQIFNILALRYDTSQTSNLAKLNWPDFLPSSNIPSLELIESLMKKSIQKNLSENSKKISIALSGGIDSTLVLAITKKYFPDVEVDAFSVQFSDSIDETEQAQKIADHFDVNFNKIFIGIMFVNRHKNHQHPSFLVMAGTSFLEVIHSDMKNI
jgi:asparagine synthetase B (glutamine-hydrolysing)